MWRSWGSKIRLTMSFNLCRGEWEIEYTQGVEELRISWNRVKKLPFYIFFLKVPTNQSSSPLTC